MAKARDILGMNARQILYGKLNSAKARSFCASKYATKVLLENKNIPTARIHAVLTSYEDVNQFEWETLEKNFVIKPTNGNAGKGVAIFRRQLADKQHWVDTQGRNWDLNAIKLHCFDILEGQYSTYGLNHNVIIEERVPIHPAFYKYTTHGTPDIRVIVFNQVPVMAMIRIPTAESEGRANLDQGAIGVGIDMATGVTTYAIIGKGTPIQYVTGTKKKVSGIKIPQWRDILQTAVVTAAAAELGYCAIDLFLHEEKGPMVVELNANPGLSIQIANRAGLRRRLERVQDLNVLNSDHGVRIGQALFAEKFSDKIKANDGLTILEPFEEVMVYGDNKTRDEVRALMNTGRFRSAIASDMAKKLGLIDIEDLLWYQTEKEEGRAPVVQVTFKLKNKKITTPMIVSKKLNKAKHHLEIGRNDLSGFLVGDTTQ
jgi:alpha-L-glutamate ligase-like protein